MKRPTTPASCGPAGAGAWAGTVAAGAAKSAPPRRNGSAMYGTRASFVMAILLLCAHAPRAPAVSGARSAKSNCARHPGRVSHAEPEGPSEARGQQRRQRGPHDGIPEAVGDVAEDDGSQRIAHEENGTEDADDAAPPRLGGHVHQKR